MAPLHDGRFSDDLIFSHVKNVYDFHGIMQTVNMSFPRFLTERYMPERWSSGALQQHHTFYDLLSSY